jgi:hypothetical protein
MSSLPRPGIPEHRAPSLVAELVALALYLALPASFHVHQRALIAAVLIAALVPIVAVDPTHLDRAPRWWRLFTLGHVAAFGLAWFVALCQLVVVMVTTVPDDGPRILVAALQLWAIGVIVFSLGFWELDRGGPVARRLGVVGLPGDFRFPQDSPANTKDPDEPRRVRPTGWRPAYIDYLQLSVSNATAFARSATVPLATRAKALLAIESFVGFVLLGVVIARAVVLFA